MASGYGNGKLVKNWKYRPKVDKITITPEDEKEIIDTSTNLE